MKRVTWLFGCILIFMSLFVFGGTSTIYAADDDKQKEESKLTAKDDAFSIATRLKNENLKNMNLLYTAYVNISGDKAKSETDLKATKTAYAEAYLLYQRKDYKSAAVLFRKNEIDIYEKLVATMKIYYTQCTQLMKDANKIYVDYKIDSMEMKKRDSSSKKKRSEQIEEKKDEKKDEKADADKQKKDTTIGEKKKETLKPLLPEEKMEYLNKYLSGATSSLSHCEEIINPRFRDCTDCKSPFDALDKDKTQNRINELIVTIPIFRACKGNLFALYNLFEQKSDEKKESEELVLEKKYGDLLEQPVKDILKNYRKHLIDCKDQLVE